MSDLPALLRAAERRVNAHIWPNSPENIGVDSHLASIPAQPDTDADLLLVRAADRIEALEAALRGIATNTLKQGSTDERRNEGIKIGLAMAADMARRALESTHPASADTAPMYSPAMCPHGVKWGFGTCFECEPPREAAMTFRIPAIEGKQ